MQVAWGGSTPAGGKAIGSHWSTPNLCSFTTGSAHSC